MELVQKICSMECCEVLYAHIGVWHSFLGLPHGVMFLQGLFWHPFELDLTKVQKFADLDQ